MCASDGYSYERADIDMYVKKKKKDGQPIVSPMDPDKVSAAPPSLSLALSLLLSPQPLRGMGVGLGVL